VAQQRKSIAELERRSRKSSRGERAAEVPAAEGSQIRFSPAWVIKHRKKLKMSRRVYAKLVGVSAQSIFGWETGRARPRRSALETWRRIRGMGKRELTALLKGGAKSGRGGAKRRVAKKK
jgi:DNA-binding transcriptional regulator YiaG